MRKLLLASLLLLPACREKAALDVQLASAFGSHLKRLDPAASLDSIRILWQTPVNERLGVVINDTVYVREYNRINAQMASAQIKNDKDSIAFYRYEIRVLQQGIDSISKSIPQTDTTRRFGSLIACEYFLRKDGRTFTDSTLLYLDSASALRYTAYMDSSIARTLRR